LCGSGRPEGAASWALPATDVARAPAGFIDGDLVEVLLDLDRAAQERVVAALNELRGETVARDMDAVLHPDGTSRGAATLDEVLKTVEDLSRLH